MILLPRQFWSQPQTPVTVHWSNPLARNLQAVILPTSNQIIARAGAWSTSSTPPSVVNRLPGRSLQLTGSTGYWNAPAGAWVNAGTSWTLFAVATLRVTSTDNAIIGIANAIGSNIQDRSIYVTNTNVIGAYVFDGSQRTATGTTTLTTNKPFTIAAKAALEGGANRFAVFLNGNVEASLVPSTLGYTGYTTPTIVSGYGAGTAPTMGSSVDLSLAFVFSRGLSDAEIRILSDNPWQIFKKEPTKLFAGTAASGAQTLTPSLFTNTNSFYTPTVTAGAVTLTPALFTNSNAFYSAIVSQGGVILQPDLFTNTNSFYSATVTVGAVTLTPDLYTNTNSFYSPTVTSTVTLTPDLYTNGQTFYTPTVTQGAAPQTLTPALYTNTNTFYSATVIPGAVTLTPALFTNTNAFYSPTVVQATLQTLAPDLFVNANTIFLPVVDDGTRVVSIADVGAEDERRKKRQKKRDKEFALLKQEQSKLRQEIERVIDPVVEQSQPVIVSPTDREVRVLSVSGTQVAVTVPESFDAAQIAREIAQIFEQSRIQATVVERAAQTQQALTQAQEQYRRKMKRRRDDELLLLMD